MESSRNGLRECHYCCAFSTECVRREDPTAMILGQGRITQMVCQSCARAQDLAVITAAQKLLGIRQAA